MMLAGWVEDMREDACSSIQFTGPGPVYSFLLTVYSV